MARFLKNRKVLVDKSPGSLTFIGRKKMEATRFRMTVYDDSHLAEYEEADLMKLLAHVDESRINWINIDGLHDAGVISKIGKRFNISPLVLDDIVNTDQRPKLVDDGGNKVVFLKQLTFNETEKSVSAEQITLVLGSFYVISFQEKVGGFFNPIRERLRQNIGKLRVSKSDYLLYRIIDTIVDNYLLCVSAIGELVEENEEHIITSNSKETIEKIYRQKMEISFIRKAVRPAVDISKKLKVSDGDLIKESSMPFFADLDDLLTHTLESVEVYHAMISDQLNIYNTRLSNSANDVMKVLTIFAAIFIPLTFVAGVYGTNFDYVPELHYRYSYFIMWGLMIVMALVMLFFFRKKKWL